MATKKRKAKRGGGRHEHSGVLTGIKPESEEWSDTSPLTPKEKQTIRDLEWSGCTHAVIEDEIGKGYKRTDSGDLVAVNEDYGALIVEWKTGRKSLVTASKTSGAHSTRYET